MLKAYIIDCGDNAYAFYESCLVYHETEEAARELGRHDLSCGPSYNDTRAERAPEHDEQAATKTEPAVEDDPVYLRTKGWGMEGESSCCSCGLKAFGQEEFGVCRRTYQCKECGCDEKDDPEKCDHRDGFSCG